MLLSLTVVAFAPDQYCASLLSCWMTSPAVSMSSPAPSIVSQAASVTRAKSMAIVDFMGISCAFENLPGERTDAGSVPSGLMPIKALARPGVRRSPRLVQEGIAA